MKRRLTLAIAGLALVATAIGAARAQEAPKNTVSVKPAQAQETLWIFFAPGQDISADLRALAGELEKHSDVALRPCLLASDARQIESPTEAFASTLKELRSLGSLSRIGVDPGLRVLDEDGLAQARRLGIDSLPAWALVAAPDRSGRSRARVAYGFGARFKELYNK